MSMDLMSEITLFFTLLIVLIICFIVFYILYKLRHLQLCTYKVEEKLKTLLTKDLPDLFHQIQGLQDLHKEVNLDKALPKLRGSAASPDFLLVLVKHIKKNKPEILFECGSGTSTIVLAKCLQENGYGHIYSLEHDPIYANKTSIELEHYGLQKWATVINAPITTITKSEVEWKWYSQDDVPDVEIDMLVVDGPPKNIGPLARYPALPILKEKLKKNAVIFLDDTDRTEERQIIELWNKEVNTARLEHYDCEKGCVSITVG